MIQAEPRTTLGDPRSLHRRCASPVSCGAALIAFLVFSLAGHCARSESLFDETARARMLTHSDGLVAHIETRYNNIFIIKRRSFLFLTTRLRREDHIQSVVNLKDPDDMMAPYTRIVSVALVYPETIQRILMVGLGAGSISTYIARAMPDVHIDAVEVDPGVIAAGRRYFGLKETGRVRFIESDGRTYLSHKKELYDIVLLDAFRELGVPSDLRTREFYKLVKEHLAPHGVAVFNIAVGPKFYRSTLVSLREVFQAVDIYPDRAAGPEEQAIAVAVSAPKPSQGALLQRARALQDRFHFRYPLPVLLRGRAG
jgi:spermidine synthase